jgi:hypothetical protein
VRTVASSLSLAGLALASACATGKTPAQGNGASMSLDAADAALVRFQGRFTPVSNLTSGNMTTGSTRIVGTVRVMTGQRAIDVYAVELDFTTERGAEELLWSVVPGRCASGSLPLVPPTQLSPIEVPGTGSVRTTRQIRATLSSGMDYHLNLYANGGSELSSVIGCANLKG